MEYKRSDIEKILGSYKPFYQDEIDYIEGIKEYFNERGMAGIKSTLSQYTDITNIPRTISNYELKKIYALAAFASQRTERYNRYEEEWLNNIGYLTFDEKEFYKEKGNEKLSYFTGRYRPQATVLNIFTRISPFLIIGKRKRTYPINEDGERKWIDSPQKIQNSFGVIEFEKNSDCLIGDDETTFYSLLAHISQSKACYDGCFLIKGNKLNHLNGNKANLNNCNNNSGNPLIRSLHRLHNTRFRLNYGMLQSCLSKLELSNISNSNFTVKYKPSIPFLGAFMREEGVTNFDVSFRNSLRSDISKKIYLYMAGQNSEMIKIGLKKIIRIVNLDPMTRPNKSRQQFKSAINELKDKEFLSEDCGINDRDIVHLRKIRNI